MTAPLVAITEGYERENQCNGHQRQLAVPRIGSHALMQMLSFVLTTAVNLVDIELRTFGFHSAKRAFHLSGSVTSGRMFRLIRDGNLKEKKSVSSLKVNRTIHSRYPW